MNEVATPKRLIEYDSESHVYYVDGEQQQHVTGVLKAVGAINTDWFTEYGRWRGSAVHRATQLYDEMALDRRALDPAIKPRVLAWHLFKTRTKFVSRAIEQPVFDDTYQYAGTLDREGFFFDEPDIPTIIDIKNYDAQDWAALQMAAYGRALDPRGIFRRIAVELKADGTYSLREFSQQTYLSDVNVFLAMLGTARWNAEHSNKKGESQ